MKIYNQASLNGARGGAEEIDMREFVRIAEIIVSFALLLLVAFVMIFNIFSMIFPDSGRWPLKNAYNFNVINLLCLGTTFLALFMFLRSYQRDVFYCELRFRHSTTRWYGHLLYMSCYLGAALGLYYSSVEEKANIFLFGCICGFMLASAQSSNEVFTLPQMDNRYRKHEAWVMITLLVLTAIVMLYQSDVNETLLLRMLMIWYLILQIVIFFSTNTQVIALDVSTRELLFFTWELGLPLILHVAVYVVA